MIDFHSHILPEIDDGSRSVEESLLLLTSLAEQGAESVVATPHFHANHQSVDDFIKTRNKAYNRLKAQLTDRLPNVLCGAEVRYYSGISRMENIEKLCIEGSRLLLLEMPMSKWTECTVKELVEIARKGKVILVLAHFERYSKFQSKSTVDRLYKSGILMQFNASCFIDFWTKRKAISLLKKGKIHLIGSDCHSITSRPPKIGKAFEIISKKLGKKFVAQFNEFGEALLEI